MKKSYYIAYGSNMDVEQMRHRCPTAELVGRAKLVGWQLLFKGSRTGSYATIEEAVGYTVPVLVWTILAQDERNLDWYEGFPHFYYKRSLNVRVKGKLVRAMVYIMHEERQCGTPSAAYYSVIERAYDRFGFDKAILKQALDNTVIKEVGEDVEED